MSHSDDKGLVLPPKLAPTKAVLVPIYRKDEEKGKGAGGGAPHRQRSWARRWMTAKAKSPGAKFFHWERRGVPVVLELGPRDLASGNIVLKRRDTGTKEPMPQAEVAAKLPAVLAEMQQSMYDAAKQRLKDNTVLANSIEEVESILKNVTAEKGGGKFVMAHMKDDPRMRCRASRSSRPPSAAFLWWTNTTGRASASSPASRWTVAW